MTTAEVVAPAVLGLKVGDLVEVRSAEEIRATLDENGELDGLPFMPEMLAFCGRRLTVHKVAHKSCDNISRTGLRRMTDAVHLTESRCDGSAHGGCENACSLYWKEQWLKRVDPDDPAAADAGRRSARAPPAAGAEDAEGAVRGRRAPLLLPGDRDAAGGAAAAAAARTSASTGEDVTSGNAGVLAVVRSFLVAVLQPLPGPQQAVPAPAPADPRRPALAASCRAASPAVVRRPSTSTSSPGELVRIKSREEIMATLDANLLNRGMGFDAEMSRFCGRTARVKARANRCVDEQTGRMLTMKNPCIILEDIVCEGAFSANCPREFVCWWREIWLERVGPEPPRD